ncbi:unnamed protein product [Protopolystoma xenopodis]|uniref:Uncharacterized protein n=1 Tax=Protopolystoma xenopodis TaxID=117903 RepID=A0A448WJE1_9PLAT|nr:unnamed protein product [Protopolystoma xenopodis]
MQGVIGGAGEKALRQAIGAARRIGNLNAPTEERDALHRAADELEALVDSLVEYRLHGEVGLKQGLLEASFVYLIFWGFDCLFRFQFR